MSQSAQELSIYEMCSVDACLVKHYRDKCMRVFINSLQLFFEMNGSSRRLKVLGDDERCFFSHWNATGVCEPAAGV